MNFSQRFLLLQIHSIFRHIFVTKFISTKIMKVIISHFLLFISIWVSGQNNNRYYPSLQRILNSEADKKMPKDFKYYDDWINNNAKSIFYKNLQQSLSNKGDQSFMSVDLMFPRQNIFKLGNSGIELVFNKNKSDDFSIIPIQAQESYRISAFLRDFNPNDYDPKNSKQKFNLALTVLNISEEQVLKMFLDTFVETNKNEKLTDIQQLIFDLKNEAKIKIAIDEKTDKNAIETIVSQIQKQMKRLSSDVLYDIYIHSKDEETERSRFRALFRKAVDEDIDKYIDDVVAYNVLINIPENQFAITFPKNVFKIISDKNNSFEINPNQIVMKSVYTNDEKCVEFALNLENNNDTTEFYAVNEIRLNHHPFIEESKRTFTKFRISDIKTFVVVVYENEIVVKMTVKNPNYTSNFIVMKQPFGIN